MHADHCPAGAGAGLHQVTDLVDEPKPVAAGRVRGWAVPAGERIGDVAAVLDLADQLIPRGPDRQDTALIGVAKSVRGKLAHREDQVRNSVRRKAEAGGVPGGECPWRSQVGPVGQGRGPVGRHGQGPVTLLGNQADAVPRAVPGASLTDEHRVGALGGPDDARVEPRAVVGAKDADRDSGERQVHQGLVPDRLALPRDRAGRPAQVLQAADRPAGVVAGEGAHEGNDPARSSARAAS
jgi:hypothetical protein